MAPPPRISDRPGKPDRTVQMVVWVFAIVEAAGIAFVLWYR
jgi:hypothetical protein